MGSTKYTLVFRIALHVARSATKAAREFLIRVKRTAAAAKPRPGFASAIINLVGIPAAVVDRCQRVTV